MASREMIDVLQRLRELDETNPNVHTDALENTEKMNPPVEEAKKKKLKSQSLLVLTHQKTYQLLHNL